MYLGPHRRGGPGGAAVPRAGPSLHPGAAGADAPAGARTQAVRLPAGRASLAACARHRAAPSTRGARTVSTAAAAKRPVLKPVAPGTAGRLSPPRFRIRTRSCPPPAARPSPPPPRCPFSGLRAARAASRRARPSHHGHLGLAGDTGALGQCGHRRAERQAADPSRPARLRAGRPDAGRNWPERWGARAGRLVGVPTCGTRFSTTAPPSPPMTCRYSIEQIAGDKSTAYLKGRDEPASSRIDNARRADGAADDGGALRGAARAVRQPTSPPSSRRGSVDRGGQGIGAGPFELRGAGTRPLHRPHRVRPVSTAPACPNCAACASSPTPTRTRAWRR